MMSNKIKSIRTGNSKNASNGKSVGSGKGRRLAVLLGVIAALAVSVVALSSCNSSNKLTMYVGLGNNGSGYYEKLKEAVKKSTGVELEFVYTSTMDGSNMMVNALQNGDAPADIVITACKTDNEICKKSLLDLASYTNAANSFPTSKIEELSYESAVYQLPYSSRLVGIEYNETLMKEMGWELPDTYDEMVALKEAADAAGIQFAVSGGVATGHGFNYLFYLMGADYLTSFDGTEWFNKYRQGSTTIDAFAEECAYFEKYASAGLFGTIHSEDWLSAKEFCRVRALFYYNITNDASSYDGYQYNTDGTIVGATYDNGKLVVKEDKKGEAVCIDGEYVLYDENNEEHKGLTRYTIPGAKILHDTYGSMPWISEDGKANFFAVYDNMYIGLNKDLADDSNKLEAARKVIDFMSTDEATDIFSSMYPDGYVSTTDYKIDKSRMYYEYGDMIKEGYTMPWYYNQFDADTIVNVGEKVNKYLMGQGSFSDALAELDAQNKAYVEGDVEVIGKMDNDYSYEETAAIQCEAAMLSAQEALKSAGINKKVTVAILPYMEKIGDINKEIILPVVQSKFYKGDVETVKLSSYINSGTNNLVVLKLTGKEINKLCKSGYNSAADYDYDHTFDYKEVVKDDTSLKSDKTYYVAVPKASIETETYAEYEKSGKVVKSNGAEIAATLLDGMKLYFK